MPTPEQMPVFVVNTQGFILHEGRYLMIVRGEGEAQAPGALSAPGGKVEYRPDGNNVVEDTLRRELREETGVTVGEIVYIRSSKFTLDTGEPVVDLAFLCKFESGQPQVGDPNEVATVEWMRLDEIETHPRTPPWTLDDVRMADSLRKSQGW